MAIITTHTNDSDNARTGVMVIQGERSSILTIEPCWLPQQEQGFVRFTYRRGTYEVEEVYDYQAFVDIVEQVMKQRRERHDEQQHAGDH